MNIRLALLSTLVFWCAGLSFKPTTRQMYCFRKMVKRGETLNLYAHISGTNPDKVQTTLFDPFRTQIYKGNEEGNEMHDFTIKSEQGGIYELCFETREYKDKEISFSLESYDAEAEAAHADEESIQALEAKFQELSNEMEKIRQHIESQQNDEEAQYAITKANNRKVLWWSLGKILLIICACLFEVYLVTSYFAGHNTLGKRLVKLGMKSDSSEGSLGLNTGV